MIHGTVDADLAATISIRVEGPGGQGHDVTAIIDTGLFGWLVLPLSLIRTLGLPWLTQTPALLADGSTVLLDDYEATVIWDGTPIIAPVGEGDIPPLVGLELLRGYDLHIELIDGGSVTLNKRP
jgi:clan AA aspartic protease